MPKNNGMGQVPGTFTFNYPGPMDTSNTGLDLGLGKKQRGQFRGAAEHGDLAAFMAAHPHVSNQFNRFLSPGASGPQRDIANQFVWQNNQPSQGLGPNPSQPAPAAQPPGVDPNTPLPNTPDFMSERDKIAAQFQAPMSDIYQAYMRSFNKGGPLDIPSWQEMYGSYRDVAEKEAQRRAAQINEPFGSQGARYSSDILNAQNQLQRDVANDLRYQSNQFLTSARTQQFNEMNPIAQSQNQLTKDAWDRMMAEYIRNTSPPPIYSNQPPVYQQPTTVLR